MALARHLLHLRGNSANASHACDDRIILMHVGRSSVPLCWVGRGAPHQAVILLNACWEAGCTGVPITKHRLGAGFAASTTVTCQCSPLNYRDRVRSISQYRVVRRAREHQRSPLAMSIRMASSATARIEARQAGVNRAADLELGLSSEAELTSRITWRAQSQCYIK
jgi:branched-subunit amino acid aminotransferase/4-amino-4-deoxychorismate lyase